MEIELEMIEVRIQQAASDISILQNYINVNKNIGFNNSARLLEVIAIKFFQISEVADLSSMNQISVNFPAIDAADNIKKIAVQTTSVADTRKVRKTISAFEKVNDSGKSLSQSYDKLYILGFCRAVKVKNIPSFCEVLSPSFFLDRLLEMNSESKIQNLIDSIRQHSDYSSLHPYSDPECLQVVLRVISRNAIKHRMYCEGNLTDMTRGLREISELIGKGTVGGREMSKPMHSFEDHNISSFLISVLDRIGRINGIINSAEIPDAGIVNLSMQDMEFIDGLKHEISSLSMRMAETYNFEIPLEMHD